MNQQPTSPAPGTAHVGQARLRRVGGVRRQHGAVAVLAAIFLIVALATLGALDIGNLYFVRRQLQRTADLAAMAAVQVLSTPGGCGSANTTALTNAAANGFAVSNTSGGTATNTLTTTCGRWSTSAATHFSQSGTPFNAVQVQVTQRVADFFVGPDRNVSATSTAVASNLDQFMLSTGIATLNTQQSALLNAILGGLLNTSVALSVGDTQSLAAANISLGDLMVALNAASMQGLLSTSVSYQKLTLAMVTALQKNGDTVNASILQALAVKIPGGQNINLSSTANSPGLLSLGLANPDSAATATVNVLNTVLAAAQIAQSNSSGTAPVINVAAGLTGIANTSIQIINPPVLALGEGNANPPVTASTAAIRVSLTLAALPAVNLGLASVALLNTPLMVTAKIAPATAQLSNVDCESTKAATQATIQVTPSIASVCLGGVTNCDTNSVVPPVNVASVTLLGINVLNVSLNGLGPASLTPGTTPITINGSSGSFNVTAPPVTSNALGSDLSSLTTTLLNQLPNALSIQVLSSDLLSDLLSGVLTLVTTTLSPLLTAVFSLLNTLIVPTLSLLGVQIGTATVHNLSLTCGVPQLVQ
jgi:uncharacterized membrane protein